MLEQRKKKKVGNIDVFTGPEVEVGGKGWNYIEIVVDGWISSS